ncbi:maltokinase N-terminal cap-like domain-containing protein [Cellulomonas taurus]|uniref:maltokinase N-terminal cap-like domain-containing protein n=1 Tax=Cellulomonas taurus TaxID=2729175 RepID=UPI0024838624|nr:aminoglycoside phosphotransferase [Cellulomonas taurus]
MSDRQVSHEPRDDALAALLGPWLPHRRWFPAKGTDARVSALGGTSLADPQAEADVRVLLLRVESGSGESVLQVPLTLRPAVDSPDAPDDPALLVGTLPDGTRVRDGAGDPAFLRAWLADAESDPDSPVRSDQLGDPRVISGEQSNTSVILPGAGPGGRTAMLKVFRGLSAGENPDVDVPRALARVGWEHVPRPLAWMSARWPDRQGVVHGHLEVLSAFVPGAQDGFELACEVAGRGESFADLSRELGEVIAQMHVALAKALPVDDDDATRDPDPTDAPTHSRAHSPAHPDPSDPTGVGPGTTVRDPELDAEVPEHGSAAEHGSPAAHDLARSLTERYAWAAGIVPQLAEYREAVHSLADRVRILTGLPDRQRVHGDLHLGQVLRGDDTWYVLDFEGEPLRPMSERTRPDQPLRDAAGMLRSFDYAAAVGSAPDAWTRVAREAFWAGYTAESSVLDPALAAVLLRTLELDKALYEAVYEARNRPDWLPIPLHGIERLLA